MSKAFQKKALPVLLAVIAAIALASTVVAQQQNENKPAASALVRLLQSKGILTEEEAAMVGQAASPSESEHRLARLLLSKGLITQEDYNQTVGASTLTLAAEGSTGARVVPAVLRVPVSSGASVPAAQGAPAAQKPPEPKVIPAVGAIRVFPVDPPKREGLVPDLKVGPVRLKPYGFFKTSVVYDTSSPEGNDFPLPGFRVDTGPDASPEFHIKARGFRIGSNFEWVDPSPKLTVTGRFEMDFEGNFTRVANRNISSIRSSQPSIRLAWGRVDYAATDHTSIHALFGQDWTPFGSSTLPSLMETTGLGLAFGTLYERAPQARFGMTHNFGGSRNFKIQPEVAVVLPVYGNLPGNSLTATVTGTCAATPCTVTSTGTVSGAIGIDQQLSFGERQGVDSARPEVQGRIALQFQLDKARGVAPAQIIVSGMQGERQANVLAAAVPATFRPLINNGHGAQASSTRFGGSAEVQLPTRFATLIAKYWNGEDLRFYFAGQFGSTFNDTAGLFHLVTAGGVTTCVAGFDTGLSVDASSTVAFGFTDPACASSSATTAPQRPVRAQGGFVNVGFPLGRIFGANPDGRNAGWQLYLHYGVDQAKTRDIRRVTAINTNKGDLAAGTLLYKLNTWVTFGFEQSLYRSRAKPGTLPNFRGVPARSVRDLRSEFGTIFTF